jgi:hypothetical protein
VQSRPRHMIHESIGVDRIDAGTFKGLLDQRSHDVPDFAIFLIHPVTIQLLSNLDTVIYVYAPLPL